jgi:hypothetical protein
MAGAIVCQVEGPRIVCEKSGLDTLVIEGHARTRHGNTGGGIIPAFPATITVPAPGGQEYRAIAVTVVLNTDGPGILSLSVRRPSSEGLWGAMPVYELGLVSSPPVLTAIRTVGFGAIIVFPTISGTGNRNITIAPSFTGCAMATPGYVELTFLRELELFRNTGHTVIRLRNYIEEY